MKAIYTASISWGMVNIPCKLFSAVEDGTLKGHQVHCADHGRIRYRRVCEACDTAVENDAIATSYDTEDGTVVLTADDLSELPSPAGREIEVLEFVGASEIDSLLYDRPYYLDAADVLGAKSKTKPSPAAKAYALLAKVLESTGRVAIVQFAFRGKNHLGALRTVGKGHVMAIHTLRWAEELREPDFPNLDKPVDISEAELTVATQLVESMVTPFNPDKYRDTYQDELRELIASKTPEGEAEVGADYVADLISKLEGSLPKPKRQRKSRAKAAN